MIDLITVPRVEALYPCPYWTTDRLEALIGDGIPVGHLFDGRRLTSATILDRIWLAARLLRDDRRRRLFGCACATRALKRATDPDLKSLEAVAVALRFADGKASSDELAYAYAAYAYAYAAYAAYAAAAAEGQKERRWQLRWLRRAMLDETTTDERGAS